MSVKSFFTSIEGWFVKTLKNAPAWNVTALSTINRLAPEAEMILSLVDSKDAAVVNPIINEVQADMGTLADLLKSGNTANVTSFAGAIQSNLKTLLTDGHISNPDSVAKATGIVEAINSALQSMLSGLPSS